VRLLVTGGAGFIGSHYVRCALRGDFPTLADAEVVVLDKLTYAGNRDNLAAVEGSPRLEFVTGDVCDSGLVDSLMAGVDEVVHFAAESHVDRSIADSGTFTRTNVVGTNTLLDAALRRRVRRFVHVSTDEVYGSVATGAATEEHPLEPSSPYAASKAAGDHLVLAYHRTHGLPVAVTRGSNTYGPFQLPEKLVPRFVTLLLRGLPVPLYGDGRNVREWLHVHDHARGVETVRAGGRPGAVYNLGGGLELTNEDMTDRLLAHCGADRGLVQLVGDRPGHDRRYAMDWSRIAHELGFAPTVPFERGIAETVRWYRDHPEWWADAAGTET
jgi:dTDP-glucose 4,6-dehydratase